MVGIDHLLRAVILFIMQCPLHLGFVKYDNKRMKTNGASSLSSDSFRYMSNMNEVDNQRHQHHQNMFKIKWQQARKLLSTRKLSASNSLEEVTALVGDLVLATIHETTILCSRANQLYSLTPNEPACLLACASLLFKIVSCLVSLVSMSNLSVCCFVLSRRQNSQFPTLTAMREFSFYFFTYSRLLFSFHFFTQRLLQAWRFHSS